MSIHSSTSYPSANTAKHVNESLPTTVQGNNYVRSPQTNRPNYTKSNAYQPIALESTIGKVPESVMAKHISYLCETFNLLPKLHFSSRPRQTTEDVMLILSEGIYQAWKNRKVLSAILMDVNGAFNNVHHAQLIHNMRSPQKSPDEYSPF
jgi:hypothetical protein